MIIITGCGRSGTRSASKLLTSLGLSIGHERWGKDGVSSWYYAADPRYGSPLDPEKYKRVIRTKYRDDDIVLHQTRYPLNCISLFQTAQQFSWDFVCKHIPVKMKDSLLLRCMKYWFYWNKLAEGRAHFRYQLEQVEENWETISKLIGKDGVEYPGIPKSGSRGHSNWTWEDLLKEDYNLTLNIICLANDYGYDVPKGGKIRK